MRFLLTTYDYPEFGRRLHQSKPGLRGSSYGDLLRARLDTGFLWADYYSHALRELGHEAFELVPTNAELQLAWAREFEFELPVRRRRLKLSRRFRVLPWLKFVERRDWILEVAKEQIRHFRPDVLLVRDLSSLPGSLLREMKPYVGLIIGQHASPVKQSWDLEPYDLIVSSLPNMVRYFQSRGRPSKLLRLGFDPRVLAKLQNPQRSVQAAFVGKLSGDHTSRAQFLNVLSKRPDLELWGVGADQLSALGQRRYKGESWGIDMYNLLANTLVVINQHESWAGPHANNLRMYEATGVGTFLLTDWKEDLDLYFEPGVEIETYRSPEECDEKITFYLRNGEKRREIAARGQARTLRDHTYAQRMRELLDMIDGLHSSRSMSVY